MLELLEEYTGQPTEERADHSATDCCGRPGTAGQSCHVPTVRIENCREKLQRHKGRMDKTDPQKYYIREQADI